VTSYQREGNWSNLPFELGQGGPNGEFGKVVVEKDWPKILMGKSFGLVRLRF